MVRSICGMAVTKKSALGFIVPTLVLITGFELLKDEQNGSLEGRSATGRNLTFTYDLPRVTATEKAHREPSDILLVTYMRSGSSFIGRMLGHRNDSFYWYEPLWRPDTWFYSREDGKLCHYIKLECKNVSYSTTALENNLRFLSDFYNCALRPHGKRINSGMHPNVKFVGHSWEAYRKSDKNKTKAEKLAKLEPICQRSTHRVTKVLRMDFSYTAKLLQNNPRLKTMLLLRDPRGVINSHMHTNWFPINEKASSDKIKADAIVLCSRMERDINASKKLIAEFKDRVKVIQYEDFEDPMIKVMQVYSFFGMVTSPVFVNSTFRPEDSQKNHDLFSYRKSLSWKTVQILDRQCQNVYRELGLVQYRDEQHLRDLNQSAIVNVLPYALKDSA